MLKFIKLTEVHGNDTLKTIILNAASIQVIQKGSKEKDTFIRLFDKSFFFVKESLDDIWMLLLVDNSKAPVIMTSEEALTYYQIKDGC